jgi:hypothetical protein
MMGSFTELNLAFTFSSKTPTEVLGAFRDHVSGDDPPELLDLDTVLASSMRMRSSAATSAMAATS